MDVFTMELDPKRLRLLELNARYMRHETYHQLIRNIKRDGVLTQLPFVAAIYDEFGAPLMDENGEYIYEVLSGNHRTMAAIEAGLDIITVLATTDYIEPSQRVAIQLSHNSIAGEDDPAILKQLYESLDIDWRQYVGLDDKTLELLESVTTQSINEVALQYQTVSIIFLPHEIESIKEAFEAGKNSLKAKEYWLARWGEYDRFLDSLDDAGTAYGIKNVATSLAIILEVFQNHLSDLQEGWLADGELIIKGTVPIHSIFGTTKIEGSIGQRLMREVGRRIADGSIKHAYEWLGFILDGIEKGDKKKPSSQ